MLPWTLLAATTIAPSRGDFPFLSFLRDSGTSLLPCFLTCGANSFPTQFATVQTPSTNITIKKQKQKNLAKNVFFPWFYHSHLAKVFHEHLKLFYCIMLPFLLKKEWKQGWLLFKQRLLLSLRMCLQRLLTLKYNVLFGNLLRREPSTFSICNARLVGPTFMFSS